MKYITVNVTKGGVYTYVVGVFQHSWRQQTSCILIRHTSSAADHHWKWEASCTWRYNTWPTLHCMSRRSLNMTLRSSREMLFTATHSTKAYTVVIIVQYWVALPAELVKQNASTFTKGINFQYSNKKVVEHTIQTLARTTTKKTFQPLLKNLWV